MTTGGTVMILAPSILSADFLRLGEDLAALEAAGADWVHVDVMDGHFVPNLSMGPAVIAACRRATRLPLDVHLMISNPEAHLETYVKAGADRLSVPVEACTHLHRTVQVIRQLGCKAGVALNPGTSLYELDWVLDQVDQVLLLATNPGASGQKYLPGTTEKIARLAGLLRDAGSPALIQVDGGINRNTLPEVVQAGGRSVVAGEAIFKHPGGIAAGVQALRAF
jgi:ribulose-phosphate 3-epimerase